MEKMTLQVESTSPTFAAQALGENITQRAAAPYLDLTATCNKDGTRVVIGLINRSADHPMQVKLHLSHAEGLRPTRARVVGGGDPLAENTLEKPGQVIIRETHLPIFRADHLTQTLPPCSVTVWELTQ
jgi:alpha-L-arabinofuranosidase